jgi:signal transduction histidine kinase
MNLSFRNRIAFHYMLATALIIAIAFTAIYFVVSNSVFRNLDNDLSFEAHKHTNEINIIGDSIKFKNKEEWKEREHSEVQVNPVFIQLIDIKGRFMDKSPNLKEDNLSFNEVKFGGHFNSQMGLRKIRQVQLPLEHEGKIAGYILAAMSSEAAISTLLQLRNILIVSYLFILIGLYFVSRFLAGRSIKPVKEVTNTITRITKFNSKERVELPPYKDEIYELSTNFNSLLDRIENTLERERQFTSDASHELRTPLATLIGTLEVLIRKPRNQHEYEDKIKFSLSELEKMANSLEHLLLLARLDIPSETIDKNKVYLPTLIDDSLDRFKKLIEEKDLQVELQFDQNQKLLVPQYYTHLIIENIINNAIKYSKTNTTIKIKVDEIDDHVICSIHDQGIGITKEDLKNIFDSFFRSDALSHKHIAGNGLGLSIVKKCADAIKATLTVESVLEKGTIVTIKF